MPPQAPPWHGRGRHPLSRLLVTVSGVIAVFGGLWKGYNLGPIVDGELARGGTQEFANNIRMERGIPLSRSAQRRPPLLPRRNAASGIRGRQQRPPLHRNTNFRLSPTTGRAAARPNDQDSGGGNDHWDKQTFELICDEYGWIEVHHYPSGAKICRRRDDIENPVPTPAPTTLPPVGRGDGVKDGDADVAEFTSPNDIAIARDGTAYVMESSLFRIRRITPNGQVSTIAGHTMEAGLQDGWGSQALFCTPTSGVVGSDNHLYVTDTYNQRIRKISPDGFVTSVAGTGEEGAKDGPAMEATMNCPAHIAALPDGRPVFADMDANPVRILDKDYSIIETLAGAHGSGLEDGPLSSAAFIRPHCLAVSTPSALGLRGQLRSRELERQKEDKGEEEEKEADANFGRDPTASKASDKLPTPMPTQKRSSPFHKFLADPQVRQEILEEEPDLEDSEILALLSTMWSRMTPSQKAKFKR
eukprot:jgi/Bigna1/83209/fgenesh1_pg.104_\